METVSFKESVLFGVAFAGFVSLFVGLVFGSLGFAGFGAILCLLGMYKVCEE